MNEVNINGFYCYPLKSAKGICLNKVLVEQTGFKFDRNFAVINEENEIITARENSRLLQLKTFSTNSVLQIEIPNKNKISVDFNSVNKENIEVVLFKKTVKAQLILNEDDIVLSDFLEEKIRLIFVDPLALRTLDKEYNGKPNDKITFNDVAPIHLINQESVNEVNSKLEDPISSLLFRPNIIVSGIEAYEEEKWRSIRIGNCEFDILSSTERCSLITINLENAKSNVNQEPLRTLAKHKRSKKVNFGIYLVPRKLGEIKTTDKVEILE